MRRTARWQGDHVLVEWETSLEQETLGFQLYRSHSSNRPEAVQITAQIVMSQGAGGGRYSISDRDVKAGEHYIYWLDEITLAGDAVELETASTSSTANIIFLPLVAR